MTKSILFIDELSGGWKLYGKTGLGSIHRQNLQTGWFVGWVEKDQNVLIFAYNIRNPQVDPANTRPRVRQLIAESLSFF